MNKEFIPYEQALELKELDFDKACICYYDIEDSYKLKPTPMKEEINSFRFNSLSTMVAAPLYQQAFRWFREKYDLFGCIDLQVCTPSHWFIRIDKIEINDYLYHSEDKDMRFNTYEEAELACLKKLIEIVKNK